MVGALSSYVFDARTMPESVRRSSDAWKKWGTHKADITEIFYVFCNDNFNVSRTSRILLFCSLVPVTMLCFLLTNGLIQQVYLVLENLYIFLTINASSGGIHTCIQVYISPDDALLVRNIYEDSLQVFLLHAPRCSNKPFVESHLIGYLTVVWGRKWKVSVEKLLSMA